MSLLSELKIVKSDRKNVASNDLEMRRQKLIDRIRDQIALAKAIEDGDTFQRSRFRRLRDPETGDIAEVPVKTRVRPWWTEDKDGSTLLWIKYGNRPLPIKDGKSAVRLSSKSELVGTLELISHAVRDGEFDAMIERAAVEFCGRFGKTSPK